MGFRMGALVGFAAGYYLGARAGRERYEQLSAMARRVRRSEAFGTVSERARAVVDLGVERAREAVDRTTGHATNGSVPPIDLVEPKA